MLPALAADPAGALATTAGERWDGVVAAYLAEVGQRTGSLRTPQEYGRILDRFLAGLPDSALATPAHVHAFAYAPGPSGRAPSPSTITVRLAAIRGLHDFARRMGLTNGNPATSEHVRRPRQRPPTPRGLSADELRRLLAAMPVHKPSGGRDRAIVLTCVFTALRRREVMRLRAGDRCHDGAAYYRVRTKGGLERHRELPRPAVVAIVQYLALSGRRLEELPPAAPLWDVSDMAFYPSLRRYAREAGLAHTSSSLLSRCWLAVGDDADDSGHHALVNRLHRPRLSNELSETVLPEADAGLSGRRAGRGAGAAACVGDLAGARTRQVG